MHSTFSLELTQQVIFQFGILVSGSASLLPRHPVRLQKWDFKPFLPPKRQPSFGCSSFHTAPICSEHKQVEESNLRNIYCVLHLILKQISEYKKQTRT